MRSRFFYLNLLFRNLSHTKNALAIFNHKQENGLQIENKHKDIKKVFIYT